MLYSVSLEIPAQTTESTPYSTELELSEGVIRRVWVRWRFGSGNLCGVRMKLHTFQYWPLTLGQWFPSTVHPLEFGESHEITTPPYIMQVEGYNLDDVHPHTVWVSVLLERVTLYPGLYALLEYMTRQ